MEFEIENIFLKLHDEMENKNFTYIISKLPTDPLILKNINIFIDMYKGKYSKELVLLIFVLISNPFDLNLFLNNEQIIQILYFLQSILHVYQKLDKYIYKIIAFFMKSNINNNSDNSIEINNLTDFLNFNMNTKYVIKIFNKYLFYKIMKELSKIIKNDFLANIRIEPSDSIVIKRYKIKILSYQTPEENILNHLLTLLNDSNSKLGWTLSKTIYKIIIQLDNINEIIETLNNNLKSLFANESLWINSAVIFSFLILKGYKIEKNKVINQMLFYDNKTECKSEQVRESGLFLLWALIRSNQLYTTNMFESIILISLLDASLNCRRAASSVLFELIGKIELENGDKLTNIINFHSVKRYETCLKSIFEVIKLFPEMKKIFIENLKLKLFDYHTSVNGKYIADILTTFLNCSCDLNVEIQMNNIDFLIGLSHLIYNLNIKQKCCDNCRNNKYYAFLNHIQLKELYNEQLFNSLILVYIKIMDVLDENIIESNLIFLLDKNILYEESAFLARKIKKEDFKKLLFTNLIRKNNDAYILANVFNQNFIEKINNKYLDILNGSDTLKKATVIEALTLREYDFDLAKIDLFHEYIKEYVKYNKSFVLFLDSIENINDKFLFYVLMGLEDYSVYIKGDAGYFIRKRSLLFLLKNNLKKLFEKYFIRYFVDKSAKLREELLTIEIDIEVMKLYKIELDKLEKNKTNEELHFIACFNILKSLEMDLKEEFVIGILSTYKNCDGYVFKFLSNLLIENFRHIKDIIFNFLQMERRYIFLTLYFIFNMLEIQPELLEGNELRKYIEAINMNEKSPKMHSLISAIIELI